MENIIGAISNVGFPIVMCVMVFYYWNTQFNRIMANFTEVISQLKETIAENTEVVRTLQSQIERDFNDGK